jgi:hypothetical protein
MDRVRTLATILGLGLACGLAGCGSSSKSAGQTPGTSSTATQPGPGQRLADNVALAGGLPISKGTFNHWMNVAAKSQAAQSPGTPVVVPSDPPAFTACIAQVHKLKAAMPPAALKAACQQLFRSLGAQVLDFLIKASWYEALAARQHITVTDAAVQQAYAKQKAQQFPTQAAYQKFLSQTGQTVQDVLFRFRINLIYKRLTAANGGPSALNAQAKRLFRGQTLCAPLYRVSPDCGA